MAPRRGRGDRAGRRRRRGLGVLDAAPDAARARHGRPGSTRAPLAVLVLSLVALAVELVGAVAARSLSLLADAGHLLTDVVGIGLAFLAIWFAGGC